MGACAGLFQVLPYGTHVMASWRSVQELLNHPGVENDAGKHSAASLHGRIEVRNLGFRYQRELPHVFQNLNVTIEPESCVVLCGENGAGNSTLAKLISTQISSFEGEILFDGIPASDLNRDIFRKHISIVSQDPPIINASLRDNITLRDPAVSGSDLAEIIESCGLAPIIQRLPGGLETHLGLQGVQLSGGERQRVAIARALLRKPRIAIFDEINNHLDAITCGRLEKILRRLKGICTVVLISHDPQVIDLADTKITLGTDGIFTDVREALANGTHTKEGYHDG